MDTKRRLMVLMLVVLSSLLLPSLSTQALAQVNSSFLTYTNTDLGFTIKYPSDWTVADNNMSIAFTSPDGPQAGYIEVENHETGGNIEQLANQPSPILPPSSKLTELDKNGYFLSGHPALRMIGIMSFGGPGQLGATQGTKQYDAKFMNLATILGGHIYLIWDFAFPENFPNQLQTAQMMIDSFQIISKQ